ncbi:MAG TPA: hypothetical protein VKF40_07875 [Burkholderiales bacterium]|nr:hypothetical protein [Burkholderiales bacterium]
MEGSPIRAVRRTAATLFWLAGLVVVCAGHAQDAGTLRASQVAFRDQLANNQFHRPLVLASSNADSVLEGDAYAVVAQPYDAVARSLQGPGRLCDVLILHIDVKNCRPRRTANRNILSVFVALRSDRSPADAHRINFTYRVAANDSDYMALVLDADSGPMGTKDYRIMLEAIPRDAKSSFVHLSYSYAAGVAARIATRAYLATVGRDKVGFSIVGREPDGAPVYVGNERGMIERNTMRYFLAIEAYLSACTLPEAEQPEKRLNAWFTATERYPRQLHEIERDEYLAMKRKELAQQEMTAANVN